MHPLHEQAIIYLQESWHRTEWYSSQIVAAWPKMQPPPIEFAHAALR